MQKTAAPRTSAIPEKPVCVAKKAPPPTRAKVKRLSLIHRHIIRYGADSHMTEHYVCFLLGNEECNVASVMARMSRPLASFTLFEAISLTAVSLVPLTLEEAAVASEGGLDDAAVVDAGRQVNDERQTGHQQGTAPGVHGVQPEPLPARGPLVRPARTYDCRVWHVTAVYPTDSGKEPFT